MKHEHCPDTARLESLLPRIGDYSAWSENELRCEIARRGLTHGVGFSGVFSENAVRKAYLIEILARNDAYSSELKKVASRYTNRLDTLNEALDEPRDKEAEQ